MGLAARIERAEARLIEQSAQAAARRRPEARGFVTTIGGGVAAFTSEGSPLNKVAGLGFAGALGESGLEAVEAAFAERGAPVQVELSCLAEPSIGALLTGRGYRLRGFENVLGRPLPTEPSPERAAEVEVSESPAEELETWLDAVVTGFAHPDTQGLPSHESFSRELLEEVMADMATTDGFVRYLARLGGEPAGGASMQLGEGVAQLCGAATRPEHRRRGVQSALLAERLAVAGRSGCDVAVVTTQPGSRSQENVQRLGFHLLYTRAILVRE